MLHLNLEILFNHCYYQVIPFYFSPTGAEPARNTNFSWDFLYDYLGPDDEVMSQSHHVSLVVPLKTKFDDGVYAQHGICCWDV